MAAHGACPECYAFERELRSLEIELNNVLRAQPPDHRASRINRDLQDGRDLYRRHLKKVHEVLELERI